MSIIAQKLQQTTSNLRQNTSVMDYTFRRDSYSQGQVNLEGIFPCHFICSLFSLQLNFVKNDVPLHKIKSCKLEICYGDFFVYHTLSLKPEQC